jgi:nicotinamidase-related amidase
VSDEVALIVVDMQEYFCRETSAFNTGFGRVLPEESKWYRRQVESTVIPTISALIARARRSGVPIAFTEFGSRRADGSDLPLWARRHNEMISALVGSPAYPPLAAPEARIIAELEPVESDLVVRKNTSGPLASTALPDQLRNLGVSRGMVTGVATNVCVLGMARELADSDFDVCVVADACATFGAEAHEATMQAGFPPFASVRPSMDLGEWLPN